MEPSPLRIVLASDSPRWLKEMQTDLNNVPNVQVVREVTHGVETLVACYQDHPDIVLLDLSRTPVPIPTLLASVHHFVPATHIIGHTPTFRNEVATLVSHSQVASYLTDAEMHHSLTQLLAVVMTGLLWMSTML